MLEEDLKRERDAKLLAVLEYFLKLDDYALIRTIDINQCNSKK